MKLISVSQLQADNLMKLKIDISQVFFFTRRGIYRVVAIQFVRVLHFSIIFRHFFHLATVIVGNFNGKLFRIAWKL